jgi:DivIVA domain-containing protein
VLRPEFSVRRIGERYHRGDVDQFVDRLLVAVGGRSGELTVQDLRSASFRTPLLGPGYPVEEVDDFLARAEAWLPAAPTTPSNRRFHQAPTFTPVRLREGYDVVEVDEFVDRVMATVNGQPVDRPVTAREIRKVQFTPVRVREGYDVTEVDAFLDEAESWLRHP